MTRLISRGRQQHIEVGSTLQPLPNRSSRSYDVAVYIARKALLGNPALKLSHRKKCLPPALSSSPLLSLPIPPLKWTLPVPMEVIGTVYFIAASDPSFNSAVISCPEGDTCAECGPISVENGPVLKCCSPNGCVRNAPL